MIGPFRASIRLSGLIALFVGTFLIYNAVGVAADPAAKGRGVLVLMNDWIHAAHSLTKTSTTAVQTFMSPLRGLAGVATYGKNDFYGNPPWKHTKATEFDVSGVSKLPMPKPMTAAVPPDSTPTIRWLVASQRPEPEEPDSVVPSS